MFKGLDLFFFHKEESRSKDINFSRRIFKTHTVPFYAKLNILFGTAFLLKINFRYFKDYSIKIQCVQKMNASHKIKL